VTVEGGHRYCPLCYAELENTGESDTAYPDYSSAYKNIKWLTRTKLFLFLSVFASLVCLVINLLSWEINGYLWSGVVITILIFIWSLFLSFRSKRVNAAGRILLIYIIISAIVLGIDVDTGFFRWSTTYVLPFLTMAVVLCLTLLAAIRKGRYKDYFVYWLFALIISVYPLLLFLLSLSTAIWTGIVALSHSLLTLIGLYIFSNREFRTEIKKRFHF
jgi:hypothetical protein